MNKKKKQKLNKLVLAVQKALEIDKAEGIYVYNNDMKYMQINGKPFGTITCTDEGEYSSDMNVYKWCPPTGYSVNLLGTERFSECSYYLVRGNGNEYCITNNADYSPSSVSDVLDFINFEDVPNFILRKLKK